MILLMRFNEKVQMLNYCFTQEKLVVMPNDYQFCQETRRRIATTRGSVRI